jgi:hypothetical protein
MLRNEFQQKVRGGEVPKAHRMVRRIPRRIRNLPWSGFAWPVRLPRSTEAGRSQECPNEPQRNPDRFWRHSERPLLLQRPVAAEVVGLIR